MLPAVDALADARVRDRRSTRNNSALPMCARPGVGWPMGLAVGVGHDLPVAGQPALRLQPVVRAAAEQEGGGGHAHDEAETSTVRLRRIRLVDRRGDDEGDAQRHRGDDDRQRDVLLLDRAVATGDTA